MRTIAFPLQKIILGVENIQVVNDKTQFRIYDSK